MIGLVPSAPVLVICYLYPACVSVGSGTLANTTSACSLFMVKIHTNNVFNSDRWL